MSATSSFRTLRSVRVAEVEASPSQPGHLCLLIGDKQTGSVCPSCGEPLLREVGGVVPGWTTEYVSRGFCVPEMDLNRKR